MILADTSVWIDFLRGNERGRLFTELLDEQRVLSHPWVFGELALGSNIGKSQKDFLNLLALFPLVTPSPIESIIQFALDENLHSQGIGFVDLQVLHSCYVKKIPLLTYDKKLKKLAHRYHVGFEF